MSRDGTSAAVRDGPHTSRNGAPLLSLRGVSRRFGTRPAALEGIDLTLGRGEFVALLGPSGCGKSTVLRIIAGLLAPSTGAVVWHEGGRSGGTARDDRRLGFVFQDATLMPWANALDNVALPLRLQGVSRDNRRAVAREMLDRVGLAEFAASYPRELSGGMRMRVSIARALVTQPDILLMDEPFAALDEITRNRLTDDLVALWARLRFTAVFVTHSVLEAVYLSERVVVMASGPGRIATEIAPPSTGRGDAFRTSPEYVAACRDVSAALKDAIGP